MQGIIARCGVGQARDDVIHSERKLCLSRERGLGLLADVSCSRSVGSDEFSAGLRVCSELRAKRTLKFEIAEHRFDDALELLVIGDGVREVLSPDFYCFLRAKRCHEKVPPIMHRACKHTKIELEVNNKSLDLVSCLLDEARSARHLEQRIVIVLVVVGSEHHRLRLDWHRRLSAHSERRTYLPDWPSLYDVLRFGL